MAKKLSRRSARKARDNAGKQDTGEQNADAPGIISSPAANLLLADVAIRAGSYLARRSAEKGLLSGRYGRDTAKELIASRSLGYSLTSFALAKVATRSVPGALLVGGAALAKTLFDRSQKRRKARRANGPAPQGEASGE